MSPAPRYRGKARYGKLKADIGKILREYIDPVYGQPTEERK